MKQSRKERVTLSFSQKENQATKELGSSSMRSVVIYYNIGSFLFQPSRSFSSSSFYRHTHTLPSVGYLKRRITESQQHYSVSNNPNFPISFTITSRKEKVLRMSTSFLLGADSRAPHSRTWLIQATIFFHSISYFCLVFTALLVSDGWHGRGEIVLCSTTHLRESNQPSDGENQKYKGCSLLVFLHWFNQL